MTIINLSGQQSEYNNIAPRINDLKNGMVTRKPIWDSLSPKKRIAVLKVWQKDPIVNLAWSIYKYLYKNWFGPDFINRLDVNDDN